MIKNVKVGKGGALSSPIVISVIINEIRVLKKRTLRARRKVIFDVDVKVGVPAARSCEAAADLIRHADQTDQVIRNASTIRECADPDVARRYFTIQKASNDDDTPDLI